ncbi:MAG: DUF1624 domain-containing protein [Clostridia bacterium]|nr:DUF1624 domain-containing protein [Clostridia bacterium]
MQNNHAIPLNDFLIIKDSKRIWELDALRGICILLVVLDHIARITYYYFGKVWYGPQLIGDSIGAQICRFLRDAQTSAVRESLRIVVLFIFFSICGICSHFRRSNFKRAAELGLLAAIISIGSYTLDNTFHVQNSYIEFGTIHFLSFCIFFYCILDFLTKKTPILKSLTATLLMVGIIITYFTYKAPASTPEWAYFIFPYRHYDGTNSIFYYINDLSPGDLMNLIPWSAFFLIGVAIKPVLYPENRSLLPDFDKAWHRPITFIGRHSLFIYLTHLFFFGAIILVISKIVFNTWAVF